MAAAVAQVRSTPPTGCHFRPHLSMQITHPQNVFKKREKVNMSDDLVKRLRSIDDDQICTGCYTIVEAADEAADLIEKLVAAMKEIVSLYKGEEIDDSVYARDNAFTMNDKIEQIVSKALEGKDD
jgi:hypothetical protein